MDFGSLVPANNPTIREIQPNQSFDLGRSRAAPLSGSSAPGIRTRRINPRSYSSANGSSSPASSRSFPWSPSPA